MKIVGTIKTKEEVATLREGGKHLAMVLNQVVASARPGVSTMDLDRLAESLIFKYGGEPSFKEYRVKETRKPYPCTMCISINDEIVHAIPRSDVFLKEGDVVGLDIGMWWPRKGTSQKRPLATDMAVTIGIGKISREAEKLIRATKESLDIGIGVVRSGITTGDVGYAIQKYLEAQGLGVIRDLAGHGVGYKVHEDPLIPNFGKPGKGSELVEGMVIAIEPMATLGTWEVALADDEWTFKTADGSLGAHFEHTMAVTKDGAEVLTVV